MTTLDEVLEHYQKPNEPVSPEQQQQLKESDIAIWNYLCGDGDIRHLYDYYDLIEEGK
jgi:hypothetical protein